MQTLKWLYPLTGTSQVMLVVKNPTANAGDIRDLSSIPGSERSPGGDTAIHSSILAWRIPWTGEPCGPQSMGLQRVGQDWSDLARTHLPPERHEMSSWVQWVWAAWPVICSCFCLPQLYPKPECWTEMIRTQKTRWNCTRQNISNPRIEREILQWPLTTRQFCCYLHHISFSSVFMILERFWKGMGNKTRWEGCS